MRLVPIQSTLYAGLWRTEPNSCVHFVLVERYCRVVTDKVSPTGHVQEDDLQCYHVVTYE
jgi:hypothetical protein